MLFTKICAFDYIFESNTDLQVRHFFLNMTALQYLNRHPLKFSFFALKPLSGSKIKIRQLKCIKKTGTKLGFCFFLF